MPTVAFHTLGCKVNFYDTEGIWQVFKHHGYTQVPFEETADVYVVNTCTVTGSGDKKSRQMIRRAVRTNPDSVVVVTGCYAQIAPDEIARIEGVDLVIGNDKKSKIVEYVEAVRREQHPFLVVDNILKTREFEELDVPFFEERTRANLKIQDGCNNFCTFCIIPWARGLIRSRAPEKIVTQATKLARAGYREIILTGIHTGGYGADLDGYRLAHLLKDLEGVPGLHRVRISSIEASEIDDELIEVLAESTQVVNHLHIPLQAASDPVLKKMNRHYTVQQFADKLAKLREALPQLAVTSDVIVGFPGETDEQFEETYEFVKRERFSELHVFPYSKRKGTPAAKFADQVPEDVKHTRVERLIELSRRLTAEYAASFVGKEIEVIAEHPVQMADEATKAQLSQHALADRIVVGHASNYLKVAFTVPQGRDLTSVIGEVSSVRIDETSSTLQIGTFASLVTVPEETEERLRRMTS
ncbi:tRNA (N(6)-L-threonylcarbamoyladenosine(37)-C(2))-methylthiotransferase MtaB [Alicyclobacillus fastidiosus]|uniref:tRNA (N(6)-L-threonylcarbamoyladenosine(37)-C(2))-methylthiotransferase MtaB n=1 Tax=Alicyclobacillus fastidiosus TaxID=392011 RepID=A0ABV5ACH0_9BACL|nr:tRNA (N(6)-L-threonylcarbamoyladenosine(37)-C(2))-methylthiotransferase MtaB [Alicyclobacillus fastidiosus]WEH11338.1 tRNA (N(6)-L-threonylcarbamoyladenosine(37)-C(2))-methylthiotransferase MtaB [Alicyclobacillus fastidiosus]